MGLGYDSSASLYSGQADSWSNTVQTATSMIVPEHSSGIPADPGKQLHAHAHPDLQLLVFIR